MSNSTNDFTKAMQVIGVSRTLTHEYQRLLSKEDIDQIAALLTSPNRFIEIRDALYSRLDAVTKAATEPEETEG